jgi:hypothetical protein
MPAGNQGLLHLWFVLNEPCPVSHRIVIVSLTTLRTDRDQTVPLRKADHEFITHDSIVLFQDARIIDSRQLGKQVASKTITLHKPCTGACLDLIQSGVNASPFTPKKVQAFCAEMQKKGLFKVK